MKRAIRCEGMSIMVARTRLLAPGLLGVGLFMAAPAEANIDATIGGRLLVQFGYWDFEPADNNRDFRNDLEVWIDVEGQSDTGLLYGFNVELQNENANRVLVDEASLFLQGIWGKLELGDQDGAVEKLQVFAPAVGEVLGLDGDSQNFLREIGFDPGQGGVFRSEFASDQQGDLAIFQAFESDDSTKLVYRTPRIEGFQLGFSYAPEVDTEGDEGLGITEEDPTRGTGADQTFQDFIELAIKYDGRFQDIGVEFGAAYSWAEHTEPGFEDVNAYNVGLVLSYGGWRFGGAWVDWGETSMPVGTGWETKGWNLGVAYENGPLGAALAYANNTFADVDYDLWIASAHYDLARGLFVGAEFNWFEQDEVAGQASGEDGYLLFTQAGVKF